MREMPVVTSLPAPLEREIGRVITRYAVLEWRLSRIIYALLKIGPKEGRVAVREPRATDRLEVIADLLEVKNIQVNADIDLLRDAITNVLRQRDQLAHGVWVRDPASGILLLRLTKGQWQPVKGQRGKTKRLIKPEGQPVTADDCRLLRKVIEETISAVDELGEEIDAALATSRPLKGEADGRG